MEPPLPPMHPKTPQLLEQLGLRVVDVVKWNLMLCVSQDDPEQKPTHVLKFGINPRKTSSLKYETRIFREVLPIIDAHDFDSLVLPELINSGQTDGVQWLLMNYISGEPLVHCWSELTFKPEVLGGHGIDYKIAKKSVDVLRDLRLVDTSELPEFVHRFSFEDWLEKFRRRSKTTVDQGFLEEDTIAAAMDLFSEKKVNHYTGSMFTNGDFYVRNFILVPSGKIAVVDWVGGIDPWEFVAMHGWLMMWGNAKWQTRYIREIKRHFPVDVEAMQVGLLAEAFDRVWLWRDEPELYVGFARTQMLAYFKHCLDLDYVRDIFS